MDTTDTRIAFDFDVPIVKAWEDEIPGENGKGMEKAWLLHGVASSERKDLQQEIVLQKGIDTTELLKSGKINWNHMARLDPGAVIGRVLEAGLNDEGNLYIKGKLFKGLPNADAAWKLACYFAEHPEDGRLGWSIEGTGVRKGHVVVKTRCRHVALTADPVQLDSWADVVKALTVGHDSFFTEREELVCEEGVCRRVDKALTTQSASALLLENLDSGQRGDLLAELFFGKVADVEAAQKIWTPEGTYKGGPLGAHRQLVSKGVDQDLAARIIEKLRSARLFG